MLGETENDILWRNMYTEIIGEKNESKDLDFEYERVLGILKPIYLLVFCFYVCVRMINNKNLCVIFF